ncbi:MAG: FHA domain-containing protein [Rubrivivax sp.]|nr:FHA domain-containing protein [Rubrivivax sp.]
MILTLQAVSLNDQALTRPITARFDTSGGTIGRADHSTMALPDPERFISRKQAEIVFAANGFVIRNVGAANPITVGQRTLAAGETAPLRDGDEVRIGGYLLRADCRQGAGPRLPADDVGATVVSGALAPMSPAQPRVAPGAPPARPPHAPPALSPAAFPAPAALASDNPFAELLGPSPGATPGGGFPTAPAVDDDPFAGLMPPPAGLDAALGGVAKSGALPGAAARLPDDFDPFAPSPAAQAPSPMGAPSTPAAHGAPAVRAKATADDPFADLFGDASGSRPDAPSIDQAFGLGAADAGADALARFTNEPVSPPPSPAAGAAGRPGAGLPTDPLLVFGAGGGAAPRRRPRRHGRRARGGGVPDHRRRCAGAFAPHAQARRSFRPRSSPRRRRHRRPRYRRRHRAEPRRVPRGAPNRRWHRRGPRRRPVRHNRHSRHARLRPRRHAVPVPAATPRRSGVPSAKVRPSTCRCRPARAKR